MEPPGELRVKAGVVYWQVKQCDPHLSALEVRFSRLGAIQIDYLYLYTFTTCMAAVLANEPVLKTSSRWKKGFHPGRASHLKISAPVIPNGMYFLSTPLPSLLSLLWLKKTWWDGVKQDVRRNGLTLAGWPLNQRARERVCMCV